MTQMSNVLLTAVLVDLMVSENVKVDCPPPQVFTAHWGGWTATGLTEVAARAALRVKLQCEIEKGAQA